MREGGPVLVADALAEFLADIALSRSPATLHTYRSLLRFPDGLTLPELDRAFCRQWLAERALRRSPATAATCRGALASFCSWAVGAGWLAVSPMVSIPGGRRPEPPVRVLNALALAKLREAAATDAERLVLSLLLGTGLRVSELAGARWADLDGDVLRVRSKGGRYRRVVVPPDALALLMYRPDRVSEAVGSPCSRSDESTCPRVDSSLRPHGPARTSSPSQTASSLDSTIFPFGADGIYRRVKAIARRAGLPAVSPHWLRHAWATDYYRRGSPAHLQTLGGWSSDRMLKRYAKAALEDAALDEARRLLDQPPNGHGLPPSA